LAPNNRHHILVVVLQHLRVVAVFEGQLLFDRLLLEVNAHQAVVSEEVLLAVEGDALVDDLVDLLLQFLLVPAAPHHTRLKLFNVFDLGARFTVHLG